MRRSLRIAVLECDTPLAGTQARYGGYCGVFKALLKAGAESIADEDAGKEQEALKICCYDIVNKDIYPSLDDIDAILITGSRHNSYDDDPWIVKLVDFTKSVLAQDRVRIIGVCFGHQIVGRAMGAPVGQSDLGWEISVSLVKLTEKGQELFGTDILSIHQMHRDIVKSFPPGVEPLGSSPKCEVQGMYSKDRLITIQGHPEFTEQIVAEILENRHKQGILNDELFNDGMSRVANHHDHLAMSRAFLRFLE